MTVGVVVGVMVGVFVTVGELVGVFVAVAPGVRLVGTGVFVGVTQTPGPGPPGVAHAQ